MTMRGREYGDFYGVSIDCDAKDPSKRSMTMLEKPNGGWKSVDRVDEIRHVVVAGSEVPPGESAFIGRHDDNRYTVLLEPGDRLARIERTDDLGPYDRSPSPQGSEFDFTGGAL